MNILTTRTEAEPHADAVQVPFVDLKAQYLSIREEINEAIEKVLHSAQFVSGKWVEEFEQEFARYLGVPYVVGVGSGTAALELALKTAGIGAGDEVIVPANTFFATAEAVSNVGATPVFADVAPQSFHLDAACTEATITPRTRAVIPVHLFGRAMDLRSLEQIAERHGLTIIEDAAQAQGVFHGKTKIGASGRLTCFSFYPGKNLGAYGDAGAVACSQASHFETLRLLRDHGSPSKYQHSIVGTNSRMDSIQAAVLSVKLRQLDRWNAIRVEHAGYLSRGLAATSIIPPEAPLEGEHNFHLFVVRSKRRDDLRKFLAQRNISSGIHYPVPLHLTKAYQDLGYPGHGTLPVSEKLASEILSLPMYPELSHSQLAYLLEVLLDFSPSGREPH